MKIRYQMRGLGIGMVVTAILMGATASHGIPLTDAEIKARASELGMVDSNSLKLSDVGGAVSSKADEASGGETDGSEGNDAKPENSGSEDTEPGETESGNEEPGETEPENEEPGVPESENEEPGETEPRNEEPREPELGDDEPGEPVSGDSSVTIVIDPGMGSYEISKIFAEAGLVDDADSFDSYLCSNLYSRKIVDGTYEIPIGTSQEEIAKIITRDK